MSEIFPDFTVRHVPTALAEYERCYSDPATIHATCEDYRAAASIDLEPDQADVEGQRKVTCPLQAVRLCNKWRAWL